MDAVARPCARMTHEDRLSSFLQPPSLPFPSFSSALLPFSLLLLCPSSPPSLKGRREPLQLVCGGGEATPNPASGTSLAAFGREWTGGGMKQAGLGQAANRDPRSSKVRGAGWGRAGYAGWEAKHRQRASLCCRWCAATGPGAGGSPAAGHQARALRARLVRPGSAHLEERRGCGGGQRGGGRGARGAGAARAPPAGGL